MKKIVGLLLLALVLAGCGKKTHLFKIDNQSDWRAVVVLTHFEDQLGKRTDHAAYVIGERNQNWRNLLNSISFNLYEHGDINLLSVNGAKIVSKTNNKLILENAAPTQVNVINQTGKDVFIKNEPYLGGWPIDYVYNGIWYDENLDKLFTDYKPIFKEQIIKKENTSSNPAKIFVYAWQLFEIKDNQKFEKFARKNILITVNGMSTRTRWERDNDTIYLYLTN